MPVTSRHTVDHSSKTSEEPCIHQHHDFKQEIEDSIRRCEELLSMAPMSYEPPDGKSSSRKSSRSTISIRRSDGRSDAETLSSSMESDRKSTDVDPEWKKNMDLLINRHDGTTAHVSARMTPTGISSARDFKIAYESMNRNEHDPVEVYNFTFDDSNDSSHGANSAEESISSRTRTVLRSNHDRDEPSSRLEDWAYDHSGQDSTPSTKTSRSEISSKAEMDQRLFTEPLEIDLNSFDDALVRFPVAVRAQVAEQQQHITHHDHAIGLSSESADGNNNHDGHSEMRRTLEECAVEGSYQVITTRSVDGDYEVVTTERTATFPLSCESVRGSSRSSQSEKSRGQNFPKDIDPPGSPHGSDSKNLASSPKPPVRINENAMSFSFTIPNQPKYSENWEWTEECQGVDANAKDEIEEEQDASAVAKSQQIVLEGGRMRIGRTKLIKTDAKRYKVQKRFRSQQDAMESKMRRSPGRMSGHQAQDGQGTQENRMKKNIHIPARLRHLSKPRTDLYQKFAHTRAQLEEEHMSECSFWPKVGRRPNPLSHYSAPLIQRVGGIEQRMDLRKRARKIIEREELDQCSFWPQINSNSEYLNHAHYKPIEERAMEFLKRRHAKLAEARAKEDMQMGLTFRPEINRNSVKIFKQTGLEVVNLEDRLTSGGSLLQERKVKEMPKDECTFTPEINPNTEIIMKTSKLFEGCTPDFLSRQKYCMQVREIRQRDKQKKFWAATSATFKPKTENSDAILKDSPIADVFDQSIHKRVDRLYHRDTERRRHIRQKISDAYYAQFTHHPEIDETSKLLGRSSSLYDLYKNEKGNSMKEQMKKSVEESFAKEHPFQPRLVARSPRRPSTERMDNVLHRRRQFRLEKVRVLEEMKVIRELQEFKECTFKPAVHRMPPKEREPVVVKGLGRHLELQDLAKQMKRDQEEWERKIFYQHVYSMPKRQYTIPKPFNLYSDARKRASKVPSQDQQDNQSGCVIQFKFQDKSRVPDEIFKKGPKLNSFYDEGHPTPSNPKWKDTTIWPSTTVEPRFSPNSEL